MEDRRWRVATILLAIGLFGILAAPLTIISGHPDLTTRTGRHLLAGALGIIALVFVELLICAFPLRRGESWALWAAAIPLMVLGLPVIVVDAAYVPERTRFATLMPQGIGDVFAISVIIYLFWLRRRR